MNGLSDELGKCLDVLAQRFGTSVQELWTIFGRQVLIEAWAQLAFAALCVLILGFGGRWLKQQDWKEEHGVWSCWRMVMVTFVIIAVLAALIALPILIYGGVARSLNPGFYTLEAIGAYFR